MPIARRLAFRASGLLLALALFLLLRPGASAAGNALFASPSGSGTACTQESPCSLTQAMSQDADGDTVYLAPGTYTASPILPVVADVDKNIPLQGGWDGQPGAVVVDPSANSSVLDGQATQGCVSVGSGISATYGEGALFLVADSHTTLRDCVIAANSADYGSALHSDRANVVLIGNTFAANSGSAVHLSASPALVANNLFSGNMGDAVYLSSPGSLVVHNTFVGNGRVLGGGGAASVAHIANNILSGNTTGIQLLGTTPGNVTVARNLFWNNASDPITGAEAILEDPRFVDPGNGDYHLRRSSPAIDQGAVLTMTVADDIDGDRRPIGPASDLGMDEVRRALRLPAMLRP